MKFNSTKELRLDRLSLRNFRCFSECSIKLHPRLTVLVAENGCGKTAILNALGIALGPFIDTLSGLKKSADFNRSDVRLIQEDSGRMIAALPTELEADGHVMGEPVHWSRTLASNGPRQRISRTGSEHLLHMAQELSKDRGIFPLVAFYGTDRHWTTRPVIRKKKYSSLVAPELSAIFPRLKGYSGCLSSSSSVENLVTWYENIAKEIRDPRFKSDTTNLPLLTAVREATRIVLEPTGWDKLDWDFDRGVLVVEHQDKRRLPLSSLSDGIRNMIALIADIARRCATLNPDLYEDAARETPGILLIDEVDMHLHPSWQQLIVELLGKAFPSMQLIISTHSPHVLSTVDKTCIRIIRFRNGEGLFEIPQFQTRGVESADVLARIMDVDPVPQVAEAKLLSDYRVLVQTSKYETNEGRELWGRLNKHFGSDHPVILEVETLRRLQAFKRLHKLHKSENKDAQD